MNLDANFATVVFSGGQDSTTCLGYALDKYEKVQCVSINYGQKHAIELEAAKRVIAFFEKATGRTIPHEIIELGPIFAGVSPLTNPSEQLELYENHDQMEQIIGDRVEKTFVPMRNAVFLMLAANRAAVAGSAILITGVCQADNANYPDCRADFLQAAAETIDEALGGVMFGIEAPLLYKTKAESIEWALTLPHTYDALAYSHTAYNGEYPPTGKDHASVLRAHGFEQAGVPDPLVLRAHSEGLMELPLTSNYDLARSERCLL